MGPGSAAHHHSASKTLRERADGAAQRPGHATARLDKYYMRAYYKRTYIRECDRDRETDLAWRIRDRDVGGGGNHLEHLPRCPGLEKLECRHRAHRNRRAVCERNMVHDEAARRGSAALEADRCPAERMLCGRNPSRRSCDHRRASDRIAQGRGVPESFTPSRPSAPKPRRSALPWRPIFRKCSPHSPNSPKGGPHDRLAWSGVARPCSTRRGRQFRAIMSRQGPATSPHAPRRLARLLFADHRDGRDTIARVHGHRTGRRRGGLYP